MKLNKSMNIFYSGAICPKCRNEMHILFKSELIHQSNLTRAGIIFSIGVTIVDILQSTFMLNCLTCPDIYKKVKLRTGGLPNHEKTCRLCNKELIFYIYSTTFDVTGYNNFNFLENFQIFNFQKFNFQIEDTSGGFVKKFDKAIQVGNPLPDKGTCKHYRQSFRWFRFNCCGIIYPCDKCHDEAEGLKHECEFAKTILCGYCAFEQSFQNNVCCKCGKSMINEEGGSGFWEGGKGCRSKDQMSSKDNHKFKGSSMKTISKKKMEELKIKK
jgi:uncharacterized CHY-type Zn-finger protein